MESAATFKCVIVGDKGVGKTTFIRRHALGEAARTTDEAKSVEITPISWFTNYGNLKFNVWDTDKDDGFSDEDLLNTHCAILMFDLTSKASYKNIEKWYKCIIKVCDYIPIVLVGNKADVKDREVGPKNITFHRKKNLQYYDISALANYHFEKPFLCDPNVMFVEAPALKKAEAGMSAEEIKQLEDKWAESLASPLEDEDD